MKKTSLQVSKKFHSEMTARVINALTAHGNHVTKLTLSVINAYIADGTLPNRPADEISKLIFNLLRPEIDKALERSRKARERSARTKKAVPENKSATGHTEASSMTDAESQPQPNRRLRRLLAQQEKRQQRKRDKALLRKSGTPPAQLRA